MKKQILCVVFLFFAVMLQAQESGEAKACHVVMQFSKQVQLLIAQVKTVKNIKQLKEVEKKFRDAQAIFINGTFVLYNKYPQLHNEQLYPRLKQLSDRLDQLIKDYNGGVYVVRVRLLDLRGRLSEQELLPILRAHLKKFVDALESIIPLLRDAKTAKEAADVLNRYVGVVEPFVAFMMRVSKKYPSLKSDYFKKGLRDLTARLKKRFRAFNSAFNTAKKRYASNMLFKKALHNMKKMFQRKKSR